MGRNRKHALEWHEHGDSTNESDELYKHQSQPHRQTNDHFCVFRVVLRLGVR